MGLLSRIAPIVLVGVSLILLAAAVSGGGTAPVFDPTQGESTSGGLMPNDSLSGLSTAGGGSTSPSGGEGASSSAGEGGANTQQGGSTSDTTTADSRSAASGARARAAASAIQTGLTADPEIQATLQEVRQGEASQQQLTAVLDASLANGTLNEAFRTAAANGTLTTPATGTAVREDTVRKQLANDTARRALATTLSDELTSGELVATDRTNTTAPTSVRAVNASLQNGTLGEAVGTSLSPAESTSGVDADTAAAFTQALTEGETGDELARAFDAADSPQQRGSEIARSDTEAALTEALTTGPLGKELGTHGDSTAAAQTAAALTEELQTGSLGRSLYDAYSDSGGFSRAAATTAATTSPTLTGASGAARDTTAPGASAQDGTASSGDSSSQPTTADRTKTDGTTESPSGESSTGANSQSSSGSSVDQSESAPSTGDDTGAPSTSQDGTTATSAGSGAESASSGGLSSGATDSDSLSDIGLSRQTALAIGAAILLAGLVWAHRRYGIRRDSPRRFGHWLISQLRQAVHWLQDSLVQAAYAFRQLGSWLWTQLHAGAKSLTTAVWVLLTIPAKLLAALASIGNLLIPRRVSRRIRAGESTSETPRDTVTSADDAMTRSVIQTLWREFLSAINPPNVKYKTPGEIGRYAIQRGVPSRPVQYIVETFRQAEYASQSASDVNTESVADAVSTVKTAAQTPTEDTDEPEGDDGS